MYEMRNNRQLKEKIKILLRKIGQNQFQELVNLGYLRCPGKD